VLLSLVAHCVLHIAVAVVLSVWELYSGENAFKGMHYGQVGSRVTEQLLSWCFMPLALALGTAC
jgi:hypothetical protein